MSGRLVILPHKKWNIWNQDNVEKVLKDERLNRYSSCSSLNSYTSQYDSLSVREAQEATKARERSLHQESVYEKLTGTSGEGTKPLRLDFDKAANFGNAEREREEKRENDKRRKREGVAPWELGADAKTTPWYASSGDSERPLQEHKRRRDENHKHSLDPMARPAPKATESGPSRPSSVCSIGALSVEELRQRRLDRERRERRRATAVLASADMQGGPREYSQQFHPHLTHRGAGRTS